MRGGTVRYGPAAIVLHWAMALLVAVMFPLGKYMTSLEYTHPWYKASPRIHKGLGLVVITLLVARTVLALGKRTPVRAPVPGCLFLSARTAKRVFYFLFFCTAASGYFLATAKGRAVDFFGLFEVPALFGGLPRQEDVAGGIHYILTYLTAAFAVLHGTAVILEYIRGRKEPLLRMLGIKPRGGHMFKRVFLLLFAAAFLFNPLTVRGAEYVIDSKNAHAFIQFRISHLGFSYILGRFNRFEGTFTYDEKNPRLSKVKVIVDVASVDTNNPERDRHLRSEKFFNIKRYPVAVFESTSYEPTGKGRAILRGRLRLHGVTRPIVIKVRELGAGKDPWGGYRRGFDGRTTINLKDFNIKADLGPSAREVEILLSLEGIRKDRADR